MTHNTRAEKLRQLMVDEDERSAIPLLVPGTGTEEAIKLFLERLHRHEVLVKHSSTICWLCETADLMIEEFK